MAIARRTASPPHFLLLACCSPEKEALDGAGRGSVPCEKQRQFFARARLRRWCLAGSGISDSKEPLPDGRGSVTLTVISLGLPSRDRQREVYQKRISALR